MDLVLKSFGEELEKQAISVGLLQRALAGRAAQGVGGAAALGRQVAGAATHGATTARQALAAGGGLAKARLGGVVEGGLAARRVEGAMAGPKAGLLGRMQQAEALPHAQKYDLATPLRTHEGYMGGEHAHSPQYLNTLTSGAGQIHDPRNVMASKSHGPLAMARTQVTGTDATAFRNVKAQFDKTQIGQSGGKRLNEPGNAFGAQAVAQQRAMAQQPADLGLAPVAGGWGARGVGGGTAVSKRRPLAAPQPQVTA